MRHVGLLLSNRAAPAKAAATVTILFGLASITGWIVGIRQLTGSIPGTAEMKINTALGIVFTGMSLLILCDRVSVRLERTAQTLSTLVLLLGMATLSEYVAGRSWGIDELLVEDRVGTYAAFHGRMSPLSAAAFVALGTALIALPHRRLGELMRVCAAIALLIGATSLLAYLWGASELITDRWIPPVALNTAGCFALLGGGILVAPRKGAASPLDRRIAALASVEIRILSGFILALALLLVGGSYTYRTSVEFTRSASWVAHTQEVRAELQAVAASLAGAEAALRDYLLTKDDANRQECRSLQHDTRVRLDSLLRLTMDNPAQQRNVRDLQALVDPRLQNMVSALTAFDEYGIGAARAVIAVSRRERPARQVRLQIGRMDHDETILLNERENATSRVGATTLIALIATLSVACVVFFALFRGIHREMIARRVAEDSLRASDRYNRSILESSPDCLGVLSLDGRLRHMTPEGLRQMEIDDFKTVENADWIKIWKGVDRAAARAALDGARHGINGRFQGACSTLKGTVKWWDVMIMPVLGPDGSPESLLAVSRDLTEVKRKENQLRETNTFLDLLFENLPLMVYVKDAQTLSYIRLNRECERMTGFNRAAMVGKTARDVLSAAEADAIEARDREVLATGRAAEIAEEVYSTADRGPRSRRTVKVPILNEAGDPQYLLVISADVTEQKQTERAIRDLNGALEAKARQLEITNKELESFSYTVSHDLRAPLRAIDGFALMMDEDYNDRLDAEGRRYISVIRDSSRRMGELIDDLLEFSRLGRLAVETHDINIDLLVREVVQELSNGSAGPTAQIDIGALPPARGDRGLLRQVWTNLIANAIKYSSKSAHPCVAISGAREDGQNVYTVRDNGVGFDMAYVDKLFGVFQRLHRADEFNGTGVGLAIVHRVVTKHGGRVWAEGRLNAGAVFSFTLPWGTVNG